MPVSDGTRDYIIEQLEGIVPIRSRRMFGGVGIYGDDLFFALIDNDLLYFKVDDSNRPDFEAAGMPAFQPMKDKPPMGYYQVPVDVLEDRDRLATWTNKALDVARRSKK